MRRLGHTLSAEENSEIAEQSRASRAGLQSQHQSQLFDQSGCIAKRFRHKSVWHFLSDCDGILLSNRFALNLIL